MRKKIVKLALAAAVLTGGLIVGAPVPQANAAGLCPDICCDPSCFSVRHCFRLGGSCVCEAHCSIGPGGID